MITAPGVYPAIPEAAYHDDELCDEPSLSCSIAELLLDRSPAHAKAAHPRLRHDEDDDEDDDGKFAMGSAVHAELLGSGRTFAIIEADSWRGREAKIARAKAKAEGLLPLLERQHDKVVAVASAIRRQIDDHPDLRGALREEHPREVTVIWREPAYGNVWCRCRPDLIARGRIIDLKLTGTAATEEEFGGRHAYRMGYYTRSAFYRRGWVAATGEVVRYWFLPIEDRPPYALGLFECDPEADQLGEQLVEKALTIWSRCLRGNRWPGYPPGLGWITPPPSVAFHHEARLARCNFQTLPSLPPIEAGKPLEQRAMTPYEFGI